MCSHCHSFLEHGEARPCPMQPLLIFCSNSVPFFLLNTVTSCALVKWTRVGGREGISVGGWVGICVGGWVGLCPCNIQHRNVYDETVTRAQHCLQQHKVFYRSSLIILSSKCTRLMHCTLKCAKCSYI